MLTRGDEVRAVHGGKLGVVLAVVPSAGDSPDGRRSNFELCVRWDGGLDESWCGEGDVETTGYKRDWRRAVR